MLSWAVQHAVQLRKVVLKDAAAAHVALFSALSTLQCCDLYLTLQEKGLDLQPIGARKGLQSLKLCYGMFSNLHFAVHLTSLELCSHATNELECQCLTCLWELVLDG